MPTQHDTDEEWASYRRLVLENQKEFRERQEKHADRITALELKFAFTAGKYGTIAGIFSAVVIEIIVKLLEHVKP